LKATIILIGCAIVIAAVRLRYLECPVISDPANWAIRAHEMRHRTRLYHDLFEAKAPVIHWLYMAAETAVGFNDWQIYVLGLAPALGILFALWWAGRSLWACGFWTVIQADIFIGSLWPLAEQWMALFGLLAYGFAQRRRWWPASAAVLVAAVAFKPQAAIWGIFYVVAAILAI